MDSHNGMTKSVWCGQEKLFLIYNLFYINFLQVFSIKFSVNLSSRHLVYFLGTTTRPLIVSFIPGDQYVQMVALIVFIFMLTCTVYRNKSNQIKKLSLIQG